VGDARLEPATPFEKSVVGEFEKHVPAAAKAAIDFEAFTAQLKRLRKNTLWTQSATTGAQAHSDFMGFTRR
jgi:hypothetical protein